MQQPALGKVRNSPRDEARRRPSFMNHHSPEKSLQQEGRFTVDLNVQSDSQLPHDDRAKEDVVRGIQRKLFGVGCANAQHGLWEALEVLDPDGNGTIERGAFRRAVRQW